MERPDGSLYAIARMRHPTQRGLYYRHGGEPPWVTIGYTTWSVADWIEKFGYQDADNRVWEFYGDPIELWPPGSEDEDKR